MKMPVILDTDLDADIDDARALSLLLRSDGFQRELSRTIVGDEEREAGSCQS